MPTSELTYSKVPFVAGNAPAKLVGIYKAHELGKNVFSMIHTGKMPPVEPIQIV